MISVWLGEEVCPRHDGTLRGMRVREGEGREKRKEEEAVERRFVCLLQRAKK